jgi:Fic family protein
MDFDSLEILNLGLFNDFNQRVDFDVRLAIKKAQEFDMPIDYFKFYKSVSSVYSSKIEGEKIDFDSYFKHKFLNVEFKVDYTQKADDLFDAYEFIEDKAISLENVKKAHSIIGRNLLPKSQQGKIRLNPMYVVNDDDKIEYVAADSHLLAQELEKLFNDIEILQSLELSIYEVFYFASLIHLVFVKIHPFQDGNGRTARLLEKWFLYEKIGSDATGVQLEKNYFKNLGKYYFNLKSLGIEYVNLDYSKALDFLLMTVLGLKAQVATK